MNVYFEIFKLQLKKLYHYRLSFIVSTVSDPIILALYINLLKSIYSNSEESVILGYTFTQMIWYFAATKFFYYLVWSTPDREISDQIISGRIANSLILPISFIKWTFTWIVAGKVVSFILEFVPTFIIFSIMVFPEFLTIQAFMKYVTVTFLSFILFFFMSFVIGTLAFSWKSTVSLESLKIILVTIIAGASLPLEFFPEVMQSVITKLPFQYLCYIPIQFFLNMSEYQSLGAFVYVVVMQVVWVFVFYLAARFYWRKKIKDFIAVGG